MTRTGTVSPPPAAGSRAPGVRLPKPTAQATLARTGGQPKARTRERLVRDLMTVNVFTVRPQDNLATLYDLMDSRHVRHVPVVDAEYDLVGLVTHLDLSRSALGSLEGLPLSAERDELRCRKVRDILVAEPDVTEPDATLKDAAELLLESKVGCLPVVEGRRLVGILTEADFVRDSLERG